MTSRGLVLALLVGSLGLGGCAALGLTGAAVGAGAFSAGAGAAVQAGKEFTRSGVVYRTFSQPLPEIRLALSDALARMELAIVRDEVDGVERVLVTHAREREVTIRLQPVTRTVTRLRVVVVEGRFGKDRATASEIVTQTERTVTARAAAAVRRAGPGTGASFLARDGRP